MFRDPIHKDILDNLNEYVFKKHVTKTDYTSGVTKGLSREPVLFQIDHGTGHLLRVKENMEMLISAADAASPTGRNEKLEDFHRLIALIAAQYHDIGMHHGWYVLFPEIDQFLTRDQAKSIRNNHGKISAKWFLSLADERNPTDIQIPPFQKKILQDPILLKYLSFAIEAHQWPSKIVKDELQRQFADNEEREIMQILVCMVKLADTLDMDNRRVSTTVMEEMIKSLQGNPSDFHAHIDDVSRMLMVHYLKLIRCTPIESARYVLSITLEPRVYGAMLKESGFKPFIDYLTERYRSRLDPHDNFVSQTLKDGLGITFTQVVIPQFKPDSTLYDLPLTLAKDIMASIQVKEVRLTPVLPIEEWVRSRWPLLTNDFQGIHLPWEAFEKNEIIIPNELVTQLDTLINVNKCSLITGRGACGKSVFAVAYAKHWKKNFDGNVFWLDLREQNNLISEQDFQFLDAFSRLQLNNKLLIVDNAHIDRDFIRIFLDNINQTTQGKFIFISRLTSGSDKFGDFDLHRRLADSRVDLTVNSDLFRRTAEALRKRNPGEHKGESFEWTDNDYHGWVNEFGGDLIAFGQAIQEALSNPESTRPSRDHAVAYVRTRYLDEAARSKAGKDVFLRMCAMSGLDLSVPDSIIGGSYFDAFPNFSDDGLAVKLERGTYRHWQFVHAGLADLILHAAAKDSGKSFDTTQLEYLLDCVKLSPLSLVYITQRLATAPYGSVRIFEKWKEVIVKNTHLIDQACAAAPFLALSITKKFSIPLNVNSLIEGPLKEQLIDSLKCSPPHLVIQFLQQIEADKSKSILKLILDDNTYLDVLRRTPPNFVTTFLKHVGNEIATPLVKQLLHDDYYFDTLRRSQPQFVANFLNYVECESANEIINKLLIDDIFFNVICCSQPHFAANFIRLINKNKSIDMLDKIMNDGDYINILRCSPPDQVALFIGLLGESKREIAIDQILTGDGYLDTLQKSPPNLVAKFFNLIGKKRAKSCFDSLINSDVFPSIAQKSNIQHLAPFLDETISLCTSEPHVNNVKSIFLSWHSNFVTVTDRKTFEFSRLAPAIKIARELSPKTSQELVNWILQDKEAFQAWVTKTPKTMRSQLGRAISKANINVSKKILNKIWA